MMKLKSIEFLRKDLRFKTLLVEFRVYAVYMSNSYCVGWSAGVSCNIIIILLLECPCAYNDRMYKSKPKVIKGHRTTPGHV